MQSSVVNGPFTHAIVNGEATAIEGDDNDVDFTRLLDDMEPFLFQGIAADIYAEDVQMRSNRRQPQEATVTTTVPASVDTESRGTSPLPIETESIAVGTEPILPVDLPSQISLAAIVTAVVRQRGNPINVLIGGLLDRPIEFVPDSERNFEDTANLVSSQFPSRRKRDASSSTRSQRPMARVR